MKGLSEDKTIKTVLGLHKKQETVLKELLLGSYYRFCFKVELFLSRSQSNNNVTHDIINVFVSFFNGIP